MRTITVQVADEYDLQSIDSLLSRHGLRPVGETWQPVPVHALRRIVLTFASDEEASRALLTLAKFLPRAL
jgi:hypothetical protein